MRHPVRPAVLWTLFSVALLCGIVSAEAAVWQGDAGTAVPVDARSAPLDVLVPVSAAVTVGELPNGFRYFIRENSEPENRAELRLVVNVGSVLEDEDQRGLAHFMEHMAFNGTENFERQELLTFMESLGMPIGPGVSASTSFDQTVYELRLPTDNADNMETAFQILEDWAHGVTLEAEAIDAERPVVIEEWRFRQSAQARILDAQLPVIFAGSQYASRLPIGTVESLESFEHDALRRFYSDWYRPDLMAVIAVGDFAASDIEDLVRLHFEDIPLPENRRERIVYGVPDHDDTLFSIETDPELSSTSISVYHMMEPETDWTVGGYRQRLVERLYNGMLNDRFREIAREPNPPFLRAQSSQGSLIRSKGVYSLSATVLEGGVERGLEAIFTEAERVSRFGFTDSELERQKDSMLSAMENQYANRANRNSRGYASEFIRAYLEGESIPGIEYEWELYQRFVPAITLEEVNRVGAAWITDRNRVVLLQGPDKEDVVLPDATLLAGVLDRVDDGEITPYVESQIPDTLLEEIPEGSPVVETQVLDEGITEWYLANGIRVVLKPTDFDDDEILFRGFSPGGTSLASDSEFIPASTASQLIAQGGLGPFDDTDLERVLAGKIANATPFINEFEEGVSGSAAVSDLETMFQLVYMRFTAPRRDEVYYELWRTQLQQQLANRDLNPITALSDAYTRLITQDHPRRRPMTLETLDQTDLAQSFAFYQDRFEDASDYTFVFVGDIDPETLKPLVETYLGSLPATHRIETWEDTGIRYPEGVYEEVVYRGLAPQSQTVMSFTGPFDYANQVERLGIRALATILDARLFDRLREELGGTYSAGVGPGTRWRPREEFQMTIQFTSDPARAEELVQTIFNVVEQLQEEGVTMTEVADAQETLRRQFETDFQQNRTWLSQLVNDYTRGVTPAESISTFMSSVEELTAEWFQRAARRYLNLDNYVRVTLQPE